MEFEKGNTWVFLEAKGRTFAEFAFLKKDFIYLFLERGEEREKYRERNTKVWETGYLSCNPGMHSNWELNQQPFFLWDYAQPTEPH